MASAAAASAVCMHGASMGVADKMAGAVLAAISPTSPPRSSPFFGVPGWCVDAQPTYAQRYDHAHLHPPTRAPGRYGAMCTTGTAMTLRQHGYALDRGTTHVGAILTNIWIGASPAGTNLSVHTPPHAPVLFLAVYSVLYWLAHPACVKCKSDKAYCSQTHEPALPITPPSQPSLQRLSCRPYPVQITDTGTCGTHGCGW
jgi:hypothetical protein